MTVKEKAEQLYNKFSNVSNSFIEGKRCALLCVDEIIKSKTKPSTNYTIEVLEDINYWSEVLTEIESL